MSATTKMLRRTSDITTSTSGTDADGAPGDHRLRRPRGRGGQFRSVTDHARLAIDQADVDSDLPAGGEEAWQRVRRRRAGGGEECGCRAEQGVRAVDPQAGRSLSARQLQLLRGSSQQRPDGRGDRSGTAGARSWGWAGDGVCALAVAFWIAGEI